MLSDKISQLFYLAVNIYNRLGL